MSATILDGKKLSEKILKELKKEVKKINKQLKLAIILVGDDTISKKYIELKKKIGKELEIKVQIYKYDKNITTKKLREEVGIISHSSCIGGVIVQLPLPQHINTQSILDTILAEKDVDVLSSKTIGKFYVGKSKVLPPTTLGILNLLKEYKIGLEGKIVAILGYGRLVGKPTSIAMAQRNATIIIINEFTKNKETLLKQADIIISGVGVDNLITKDMVKKGVVIIDAGTSLKNDKLIGDMASNVKEVADYITPVPGGVGPMTITMLFWNLIELNK